MSDNKLEVATLGGGCFWCLDAVYRDVRGVERVVSGYSGGHVPNPTYEQVCGKRTGHAEVVQVWFDPAIIGYEDILTIFWRIHDPTTPNRQGNDVGPQYRSIIFYHDDAQRAAAEKTRDAAVADGVWRDPIVTEIVPFEAFYEAEAYHQDYFAQNPYQPYCVYVVDPKVRKFRKSFQEKLKQTA
ncbi:peptide-methionine (S)-S-oxide reductase MsrA [Promineifilum sp.]|uniref:peptide-methionine (S)-S-oxide reductase MsrA n=1 Tax=Promineifilum sp. TaxID=2664178 RepID=UPI0035B1B2B3